MPSAMVAIRLGEMKRVLCASPTYLKRSGEPRTLEDLLTHSTLEMPGVDGRMRTWSFLRDGSIRDVVVKPRVSVNDALTINRLVLHGAGIGVISSYFCAPAFKAGRLVHILPEWIAPAVGLHTIFPSKRELAPAVRAFVDFMKEANPPGLHWQNSGLPVKS